MKSTRNKKSSKSKKLNSRNVLRSNEWSDLREHIIKRDGNKCLLCGKTEGLLVHHILPRRFYKDYILEQANLVCVCKSCHWKIHKSAHQLKLYDWIRVYRPVTYVWLLGHV